MITSFKRKRSFDCKNRMQLVLALESFLWSEDNARFVGKWDDGELSCSVGEFCDEEINSAICTSGTIGKS